MRIAMISEHASPLALAGGVDSGGQNVYVAHVARCLARQGHEVDIFTRRDDPTPDAIVRCTRGCRVIHVDAGPQSFVAKEKLLDLMPEFSAYCEAWMRSCLPYDVIHANFFMSGWVGLHLKELFRIPLVTTFHALGKVRREHQQEADGFPEERITIEHALAARSDRLIAECPQDVLDLKRLYGADTRRTDMVPCGFDAMEFAPMPRDAARARLGIGLDEFMVLQLGRMVPRKGIETVVRAMAFQPQAHTRLRIVGGDCAIADPERTPEIARLMAVAQECRLGERVVFEGRRPRNELRFWYAAADVFVTTPWYEPFGITPLEAMACARPVIGSDVGGLRFSIQHGVTGLLVPPRDPRALAVAIDSLRRDKFRAQRMGQAGLDRARRHFTWDGVARQLSAVFEKAAVRGTDIVSIGADLAGRAGRVDLADSPGSVDLLGRAEEPRPAIFLDKDGTLVENIPYNVDPSLLRLTAHAVEALRMFRDGGYRLVVVSNQSGIGRGLFDVTALERLYQALAGKLARDRIELDGFFACPHLTNAGCGCRKPQPGLLLHAAERLNIDLGRSWMIGDILNDIEAGQRAGCSSVLLDVGNETEWRAGHLRSPAHRCADLLHAARFILQSQTPHPPELRRDKNMVEAA